MTRRPITDPSEIAAYSPPFNFILRTSNMPSMFAKVTAPTQRTMTDHLVEFEKQIDQAIAAARAGNVDHRRLARALRERADGVHLAWATTASVL